MTARAKEGPNIDGLRLRYAIRLVNDLPSQSEIDELERAVKGHPQHPRHRELQRLRNIIKQPISEYTSVIWRLDGRWRWSLTNPDGTYDDCVWDKKVAWMLSPDNLRLLDPRRVSGTPYGIDAFESTLAADAAAFINADIGGSALMFGASLSPTLASGQRRWSLLQEGRQGDGPHVRLEAEGSWDPNAGWGTIDRVRQTTKFDDGKIDVNSTELSQWRYVDQIGLAIAGVVATRSEARKELRTLTLIDAVTFTESDFDDVVAIPTIDRADPLRGKLAFTTIEDMRAFELVVTDSKGNPVGPTAARTAANREVANLRWAGWSVGVLVVVVVFSVWLYRRTRV